MVETFRGRFRYVQGLRDYCTPLLIMALALLIILSQIVFFSFARFTTSKIILTGFIVQTEDQPNKNAKNF